MDKLDIAIVRELAQEGFVYLPRGEGPSLRAISRKLSLSEGAVRGRIAKLRASNFLGSPRIIPNPSLLGLEQWAYLGSVSPSLSKDDVVRQVCAVEGIFLVANFHSRALGVVFSSDRAGSPREKRILLDRMTGGGCVFLEPLSLPPVTCSLSRVDWRLIGLLARHGPLTQAKLARELGLSVRTVKRRLLKLVESWAFVSFPRLNFRAIRGGAAACLMCRVSSGRQANEVRARILNLVQDHVLYLGQWGAIIQTMLILPNTSTATALARAAKLVDGVDAVMVELVDELIDQPEEIGEYLADRLDRYRSAAYASTGRPFRFWGDPFGPGSPASVGVVPPLLPSAPPLPRSSRARGPRPPSA